MDLNSLTIEEKVGQMFMVGFDGLTPNGDIINLISKYNVSGICYFSRNLKNTKQVHTLSKELQSYADKRMPLLLSIDQEGGMVNRIKEGVTNSPSNMALGAIDNRLYTRQIAEIVAKELRAMGVNMNFDPTVDVNNNPNNPVIGVRSFGEDVKKVSQMGGETINGYQKEGVSAVVKHFPGHGDTDVDSHLDMPVIPHGLDRIESVELPPFITAVENGVDAVMVSHVSFPVYEENLPATLSPRIVQGLLREEIGFDGVIVTDCMEMSAIDDNYSSGDSAKLAIKAGIDLILVSHRYHKQRAAIDAVIEAVKSGEISEERIDASVRRILALKEKRNIAEFTEYNTENFASKRSSEFAKKLTNESITIVKDEHNLLPLNKEDRTVLLWPEITKTSLVDEAFSQSTTLGDFLKDDITSFTELPLSTNDEVMKACEEADKIIIATYNVAQYDDILAHTKAIIEKFGNKTIVGAFRNPYDLIEVPETSTYLAAYDIRPITLDSVAKVLTGEVENRAQLPVTVTDNYPVGYRYNK